MATLGEVNRIYNSYRDRFYAIQARGAGRKFPAEMDTIRAKLMSIERIWPQYMTKPDRLRDIVVNEGLTIKPMLDQMESAFPPGTRVAPGSTGEKSRLNLSDLPITSPKELEANAPPGIGSRFNELLPSAYGKWYFMGGVDLRWIVGTFAALGVVNYVVKGKR